MKIYVNIGRAFQILGIISFYLSFKLSAFELYWSRLSFILVMIGSIFLYWAINMKTQIWLRRLKENKKDDTDTTSI